MIRIASKKDLLNMFRPIDAEEVELPDNLKFPLVVRDYLAWVESSGSRVYLVFNETLRGNPLGVVFRRTSSGSDGPSMCQWCHSVRSGNAVSLLTASCGPNKRIGLHLCRDLSCKDKVADTPGVNDLRESLSSDEKISRIIARMSDFAHRNLF